MNIKPAYLALILVKQYDGNCAWAWEHALKNGRDMQTEHIPYWDEVATKIRQMGE